MGTLVRTFIWMGMLTIIWTTPARNSPTTPTMVYTTRPTRSARPSSTLSSEKELDNNGCHPLVLSMQANMLSL